MKSKILVTILVIVFFSAINIKNSVADNVNISDIQGDLHENAISYLYEQNIINGYPDGTFKPNNNINRAEFIKLVAASLSQEIDETKYGNCFPDVNNEWFAPYVCYAKDQGWVKGYADGTFKPEQYINKVETLKITLEAYDIKLNNGINLPFIDTSDTDWYSPYLQTAYDNGLIETQNDYYFPANNTNRGEVSEILYRLLTGESSYEEQEEAPLELDSPLTGALSPFCLPLTTTIGDILTVNNVEELNSAITTANQNGNTTILLEDGTYTVSQGIWISGDNIMIRSLSGDRDKVILTGGGMGNGVTHIFWLEGDNITIADITLKGVDNHTIQVHGELDADYVLLHNLHVLDAYEQLIKVSYDDSKMDISSDNGILECSLLEYSAGIGPQWYIGGIDAHNAKDWTVKDNTFKNITSPTEDLAEYSIHFWSDSENTLVENNTILNCDRGIGFGLGDRGHIGGTIKNNKIYHNSAKGDVGISLENSSHTLVEDNIILLENDYNNAIEYRFEGTYGGIIRNNITNKGITSRDGGTATLENNTINASIDWFIDPANGDFSLVY